MRSRALFARGARLGAPFGGGHPSSEKHECFGSADRALLAVVDVLAIEAEPGYAELHGVTGPVQRTYLSIIRLDNSCPVGDGT